jgi:iron complex outermembrane receptor protein
MFIKKTLLAQKFGFVLMLLLVFRFSGQLSAQQQDPNKHKNFFDMSLEQLMDVEVVSASRQAQKMTELSAPVSVITAEDIHYSGLTNIPEILQFTPGMDVVQIDRNRFAVGVRGLHDFISDRTLTLVNGRIADSPLFGGSEFYRLPVLLEDIDRIEVVRGPGGAAWGANAFTGVINIITKKPQDTLGGFASTRVSEFGDTYTHLRWAQKDGKWTWRTSAGYENYKSSDDAGAGAYRSTVPALNPLMGFNSFYAQDSWQKLRSDSEAIYDYSDTTRMSFGLGYCHAEGGDYEFGGYYPMDRAWNETARPYTRLEHDFGNDRSGYLQWFGNFASTDAPSVATYASAENDIEGQLNFKLGDRHTLSTGGNFRFIRLNVEPQSPRQIVFLNEPYDDQLAGLFAIDRWTATDRLTLEGQIRGEWYSETQTDWSTRLTGLYAVDEQKDHTLRLSFAKAFRSPLASLREAQTSRVSLAPLGLPGLWAFNVLPAGDLVNEETWALEAGYTGRLAEGVTLRADTYYQRFEKMIGYLVIPDPLPLPRPRAIYQAANIDGADTWGIELELAKETKRGRFSAWYAYNDLETDEPGQSMRSYAPAKHKVGLRGRLFLNNGWVFNANYRYADTTIATGSQTTLLNAGLIHRLDLTLAKVFASGKGEVMVGVSDLFNETEGPNSAIGQLTAHDVPGRTFFCNLALRF